MIESIRAANARLEADVLTREQARAALEEYAQARKLLDFGVATLARHVGDAAQVARATGTSMGAAKTTVATGKVLGSSDELSMAFQRGDVSLDQAAEIAKAEDSAPGAARRLLPLAQSDGFHVLKDKARAIKLEAEQHRDLATRQREARYGRSYADDLGMVHVHLAWEPHVGTPIVARAEAEAQRLAKKARKAGEPEPFERYLADAYASLLAGSGKARAKRPEVVVLVSYGVVERGWQDVRDGEVCKIPGVGPVSPQVAREIASNAFLTGLFYDGTDLRHFKRWTRSIPIGVAIALELGAPPDFDGVKCVDCGNRFQPEFDHDHPMSAGGPTSTVNVTFRCAPCHLEKTKRERAARERAKRERARRENARPERRAREPDALRGGLPVPAPAQPGRNRTPPDISRLRQPSTAGARPGAVGRRPGALGGTTGGRATMSDSR